MQNDHAGRRTQRSPHTRRYQHPPKPCAHPNLPDPIPSPIIPKNVGAEPPSYNLAGAGCLAGAPNARRVSFTVEILTARSGLRTSIRNLS
jgi:hypothetical protein